MSRLLDKMAVSFQDELVKIADAKAALNLAKVKPTAKTLAIAGGGALGFEAIRRANEDRRLGRQYRLQNSSGIF